MDSSMSYPNLSLDIQLNILDHLIADTNHIRLSKFAAVSKFWQYVVERKMFQSLTVNTFDLKHLAAYSKGRTYFIKHIVLELNLDRYQWILLPSEGCFLKTAQTLFKIISTWDGRDITLELAVLSHEEVYYKYAEEHSIYVIPRKPRAQSTFSQYKQYFELPQEMLFGGFLVDSEASWHHKVSLLLGRRALAFRPSILEDAQLQVLQPPLQELWTLCHVWNLCILSVGVMENQ
uniref:F-box domain-containing protein n=1 Tax=Gibberella zeae TaxID=5518 RepID=A0A4E9DPQ1_GIBZA